LPVVSVDHHRPGRILASEDTEGATTGPSPSRHPQAIRTPSALGEPETHSGVGQHGHRQVAPCLIRDPGVVSTHQPTRAKRDLHGAGHLRPDPLARLSDHTVDQAITLVVKPADASSSGPTLTSDEHLRYPAPAASGNVSVRGELAACRAVRPLCPTLRALLCRSTGRLLGPDRATVPPRAAGYRKRA
jgi:hypothetical protein